MGDISINVIAGQKVAEEKFWKSIIPTEEIASGMLWAKTNNKEDGTSDHHQLYETHIPLSITNDVMQLCKSSHENVHVILLTILKILIYKYNSNNRTVVFTPIYRSAIKKRINTTIPVCTNIDESDNLLALISSVQYNLIKSIKNQNYPVLHLWKQIRADDAKGMLLQLTYDQVQEINDIDRSFTDIDFQFSYDSTKGISLKINYTTEYDHGFIKNIAAHFVQLIGRFKEIRHTPIKKLDIITPFERDHILNNLNNTDKSIDENRSLLHYVYDHSVNMPEKVALTDGKREVTYGQLVKNVNRISSYLKSQNLDKSRPVGLLLERGIDLVEFILALWKMECIYLPLDVNYPEKRIKTILQDSGAALITRSIHCKDLDKKNIILLDERSSWPEVEESFAFEYDLNNLAYIIYTSGSTGNPKGAMLEHLGMMNHLYAKINDLNINSESIVAQTASHTFDISVWQMFIALVKGGKVLICSDNEVLNPDILCSKLSLENVTHLQVVPSYLVALLEYLGDNKPSLDSLKYLVSAGEELRSNLVKQWFDLYPMTKVLNAYGPTEASIDILHFLMDSAPGEFIPIGRPLQNTSIYIVDDEMNLCPTGVKGEICVAGYGVGRGYINNINKTKEVFISNPFDSSKQRRLYKTGDIGRWLPNGVIQFHGRKDHQVKVRGFRIELGEIETCLLSHPKITEAVVSVFSSVDKTNYLCAYIVGKVLDQSELEDYLKNFLPVYMVPSIYVSMESFPKLLSGKVDRKSLPKPEIEVQPDRQEATNQLESTMVQVWKGVLGVNELGVHDNFFKLGGDSIKAIQLSSRLLAKKIKTSIQDIFENPTIYSLAKVVQLDFKKSVQEPEIGNVDLTPIQRLFFEQNKNNAYKNHFNQAISLSFPEGLAFESAHAVAYKLQEHHDALRMVFKFDNGQILQYNSGLEFPISLEEFDLREGNNDKFHSIANSIQSSIDIENGPLMKLGLFHFAKGTTLLIVIHHLVTDGISWRILLEDIELLYDQLKNNKELLLPDKTDSFKLWSEKLSNYKSSERFAEAGKYWENQFQLNIPRLKIDRPEELNRVKDSHSYSFLLDNETTSNLLTDANESFNTTVHELLLIALARAFWQSYGLEKVRIDLEGHGREYVDKDVNISRTIGWFTTLYPAILEVSNPKDISYCIKKNKELLRKIPNNGFDYGLWSTIQEEEVIRNYKSDILFNYLGQFDTDFKKNSFSKSTSSVGDMVSPEMERSHALEIVSLVSDGQLSVQIVFSKLQFEEDKIKHLTDTFKLCLEEVVNYCGKQEVKFLTPSDLTYNDLTLKELEDLCHEFDVQDILTLSPAQEGILYHSLLQPSSTNYFVQFSYQLSGDLNLKYIEKSFQGLVDRYDNLRTMFVYEGYKKPLQVVLNKRDGGFEFKDITQEIVLGNEDNLLNDYRLKDRERNFDLKNDILIRLTVLKTNKSKFEFIWSFHHILMDGWCTGILVQDFMELYTCYINNEKPSLTMPKQYGHYIKWLEKQNKKEADNYWNNYLNGFDNATTLPVKNYESDEAVILEKMIRLDDDTSAKLINVAAESGVTLYTILQAAWGIVLGSYNNTNDVVFGSVVAGRPAEIEHIESMIGLFINTIPVRIKYDQERVFDLFKRIQESSLQCNKYDFYPLAKIQSNSNVGNKLINHILVYENYPIADEIEKGWDRTNKEGVSFGVDNITIFEHTNYDLSIIIGSGEQLSVKFQYNQIKFDDLVISELLHTFSNVLKEIASKGNLKINDIQIVSEDGRDKLNEFNKTFKPYPLDKTVDELFKEQVIRNKDQHAVVFNDQTITYKELDTRSDQIADYLKKAGYAKRDTFIGVFLDRSIDYVVTLLGIIKSGSAYLPISTFLPELRVKYLIENSGCNCIITKGEHEDKINHLGNVVNLSNLENHNELAYRETVTKPQDLIYMIYTSGSTGNPKGVRVTHKNIVNLIYGLNDAMFNLYDAPIKFALVSPFDFDASIQHLFGALLFGHTLFVVPEEARADGYQLMDFYDKNEIEISDGTPTHLRICIETEKEFSPTLKHFLYAGEELPKSLVQRFFESNHTARISNFYGPTETSVDTTYYHIDSSAMRERDKIPIGKPLANQSILILNESLNLMPIGAIGEICIGGLGVSQGYHNLKDLTDKYFISNPFNKEETIYRTGDLGRWLPDGNIEYLGRKDNQVKIRGFRIEPDEIEKQLLQIEGLKEVAIIVKEFDSSAKLIAFYRSDREVSSTELRSFLENKLPYYMIPSFFVNVTSIPRTSNKKVDYKELAGYEINIEKNIEFVAPENELESKIISIWYKALNIENIGVNDNFFEVGGNSLDLVRVYGLLKTEIGFNEPLVKLVQYPTVKLLAEYLMSLQNETIDDDQVNRINKAKQKKMARRFTINQYADSDASNE